MKPQNYDQWGTFSFGLCVLFHNLMADGHCSSLLMDVAWTVKFLSANIDNKCMLVVHFTLDRQTILPRHSEVHKNRLKSSLYV